MYTCVCVCVCVCRMVTEDVYVKGLSKLHKSVQHIPEATLGYVDTVECVCLCMCECF